MLSVEMKRQMLRDVMALKLKVVKQNLENAKSDLDYYNSPDYGRIDNFRLLKMHPQLRYDKAERDAEEWLEVANYVKELTGG